MQRIELRDAVTSRTLYVIEIKHKTTVIDDNSGTGKTALINLIDAPTDAGLQVISDSTIIVVRNGNDLYSATATSSKCLLIIDESLDDSVLTELLDLYEKADGNKQRYDWSIILVCRDALRLQDIGPYSKAVLRSDVNNTIRLVYEEK